jgi:hypothetical protein
MFNEQRVVHIHKFSQFVINRRVYCQPQP